MSSRSLYLVRFLTFCWVTGGHTIHPPIERLTTNWYWAHIALKLPPAVAYYYTQCLMNPILVNILVFQVSSRNTRKCVKCIKSQASFWCLYCQLWTYFATFFFYLGFFHKHSQITGLQGKGKDISLTPHYHFHPLHRHLARWLLQRAHLSTHS